MRIGSLFSGIGGLELGLEEAGLGSTSWQVEKAPFCLDVLATHWPSVPRVDDVHAVGAGSLSPVEVICGGFPCQDVSGAGKKAGIKKGTRSGLWIEFARIVDEMRPLIAIVENVDSGRKSWLHRVRTDLDALGYDTVAFQLSAEQAGAPHLRRRIFVVAYDRNRLEVSGRHGAPRERQRKPVSHVFPPARGDVPAWEEWLGPQPGIEKSLGGSPSLRAAQLRALGNAVVPQCAQIIGEMILDGFALTQLNKQFSEVVKVPLRYLPLPAKHDFGAQNWLTPTASDGKRGRLEPAYASSMDSLTQSVSQVLWPTPTASRYGSGQNGSPGDGRKQFAGKGAPSLHTLAKRWPTATASDSSASRRAGYMIEGHAGETLLDAADDHQGYDKNAPRGSSGLVLNPPFVEALMGFPIGWTDIGRDVPRPRFKGRGKPRAKLSR